MINKQKNNRYLVLTPAEEKVVKFLSLRKKASISEISRGINIARTGVYNTIKSLIKKEIVKKEGFAYSLLLNELIKSEKYDAKNKIEDFLNEMLKLKKGEIIYSIESDEEIEYLLRNERGLPKWQKTVADNGIVLKGIGSSNALSLFLNIQEKNLGNDMKRRSGSARFMVDSLFGPCVLVSFRKSVVLFSRKNKYFYRINDANVAYFMQKIIENLYLNLQYEPLFTN